MPVDQPKQPNPSKRVRSSERPVLAEGDAEGEGWREVRHRMTGWGGRAAQELGGGRVLGQIVAFLYFSPAECSLDEMEVELGLSKAAVSIAARQLETLGLVQRVWRPNDRKSYYRTVDNLGKALQQGLRAQVQRSLDDFSTALDAMPPLVGSAEDAASTLVKSRLERASVLQRRLQKIVGSPLLNFLAR
ncbi:MarR family transcriptional regulator [Kiritimatiellota bacterium B12222]|nr:MarR family transcriptional regulator [Kiritimatiellota bacterium B12222]